jgi:protein TonB
MFEDSIFESAGKIHTRSRRWMVAVFFFNTSILLALILIPLLCPQALPRQFSNILLIAPAPQQQQPPQPTTETARPTTEMQGGHLFAPPRIPIGIVMVGVPEPPIISGDLTSIGPGDNMKDLFHTQAGPSVRQEVKAPIQVPSTVEEVLLIRKTMPVYPPIARAAHIEGTVRLAATISKTGYIENLHIASGPAMLRQAALDAVSTWRYRPYLLNGQPVEVETTVDVIFTLSR